MEALEARQGGSDRSALLADVVAAMTIAEMRDTLDVEQFSHLVDEVYDMREHGELFGALWARLEEWYAVFERCGHRLTDAQLEALKSASAKEAHNAALEALAAAMREASLPLPGFLASLA